MLRQIRYFQAVVRCDSFSEAAEECHISQSAISQQIKALEAELGFLLLERSGRRFSLTPAGAYFYRKSLVITADYDRMCAQAAKIANDDDFHLRIGFLRCCSGLEFQRSLEEFIEMHPLIKAEVLLGNHEELYAHLRADEADIVLNDQRRAFSDEYVNLELMTSRLYIETSTLNPIADLREIEIGDLRNMPCVLIAGQMQQAAEEEYYRIVVGVQGEIVFAENLEEARLRTISERGYMPLEGIQAEDEVDTSLRRIALTRGGRPISRKYCAFWKKDNSGYYVEEFAELLKKNFANYTEGRQRE